MHFMNNKCNEITPLRSDFYHTNLAVAALLQTRTKVLQNFVC
ncbi:hypothetical protein C942_03749 [Photobacterium marinum]|uniref:Uncharacterized protein n=1 Tax=Photobacterium marinum TaxID=1056511 RepID=L8J3X4_9GAMM|nr:hypothetical protein C942_03749 [Photobacterium marinum]